MYWDFHYTSPYDNICTSPYDNICVCIPISFAVLMQVGQQAYHFVFVCCTEEHASRPPVQLVVIQASPAHSGSVHDGRHLCKVIQQHLIEQGLIPILQCNMQSSTKIVRHLCPGVQQHLIKQVSVPILRCCILTVTRSAPTCSNSAFDVEGGNRMSGLW